MKLKVINNKIKYSFLYFLLSSSSFDFPSSSSFSFFFLTPSDEEINGS